MNNEPLATNDSSVAQNMAPKRKKRISKKKVDEDVAKYNLIRMREDELDASIPPNRSRLKKTAPSTKLKELKRYKEASRYFNTLKPKYKYVDKHKIPQKPITYKKIDLKPVSFKSFVLTQNSYPNLISKIKTHWDDIDIPLQNGFIPKNIEYENERFNIDEKNPLSTDLCFPNAFKLNVPLV